MFPLYALQPDCESRGVWPNRSGEIWFFVIAKQVGGRQGGRVEQRIRKPDWRAGVPAVVGAKQYGSRRKPKIQPRDPGFRTFSVRCAAARCKRGRAMVKGSPLRARGAGVDELPALQHAAAGRPNGDVVAPPSPSQQKSVRPIIYRVPCRGVTSNDCRPIQAEPRIDGQLILGHGAVSTKNASAEGGVVGFQWPANSRAKASP